MAPSTNAVADAAPSSVLLGRPRPQPRKVVGRLGPWQLLRAIGDGATSRVYLARPAGADDAVGSYAVKSLRREWWSDRRAIESQRRESMVGARVNSPHVAPILAAGVSAPPYYTVSPWLAGRTAAAMLADGARPPLPVALWIARQAAQGLEALWRQAGMIHGDVKPANLMVGPDGHTTLIDLGFCSSPSDAPCWADRPVIGTLRYLAPERATSATRIDPRSDLYSLGATLYELIAGRPPHDGDTPAALLAQHRCERPECLRSAAPGTPKAVASLVHRLLAKDPLRRPASHAEVVDELARLEIACFAMR
ncbi:serine/threonine-protein kinase [Botrimarina sp.]|uniref:serine/threonine-protein kinase n=1 Tax=Botrimarina sp. TaxID=2795802 RepID=UPI0032EF5AC3